jgi:hypothetical protein
MDMLSTRGPDDIGCGWVGTINAWVFGAVSCREVIMQSKHAW